MVPDSKSGQKSSQWKIFKTLKEWWHKLQRELEKMSMVIKWPLCSQRVNKRGKNAKWLLNTHLSYFSEMYI